MTRRSACWGIVRKEDCWRIVPWARRLLWLLGASCLVLLFFGAHPFLAKNGRVGGEYLVIEGWCPNYALEQGIREFRENHYRAVITTGCQTLNGVNLEVGDNHAQYAAARLKWLGFEPASIQAVPSPGLYRNRTYLSAVALKEWFEQHQIQVKAIDVVTVGTHARRTRLLFEKAFRGRLTVGVIAVVDREYDPDRWWKSSEGVRDVIGESLAYLYARFFFWPDASTETHF